MGRVGDEVIWLGSSHLEDALVGSRAFQVVEAKVEVVGGYEVAKVATEALVVVEMEAAHRSLLDDSGCELVLAVAPRMLGLGQPRECRVWRRHARISPLGSNGHGKRLLSATTEPLTCPDASDHVNTGAS